MLMSNTKIEKENSMNDYLTLDQIREAEQATEQVEDKLNKMARKIYSMREQQSLSSQYGFERYRLFDYHSPYHEGEEGPDWGVGTPVVSVYFYWSRVEDSITVTFPQSYLGIDWHPIEEQRLKQITEIKLEEQAREKYARDKAQEERDRKEFERLRKKFGAES